MIGALRSLLPDRHPLRLLWHKCKSVLAAALYGFPARKLTVIGITGTDGKTTTVGMIAHILCANTIRVGAASTAFLQIDGERMENASHLTSLSPFTLQKFLRSLVHKGCTHAVVEMSSHGLVQSRTAWTFPYVAGITNTALEHLDYHGSMEQYRRDKAILFRMLGGKGVKVLNTLDETYRTYRDIASEKTITYGGPDADLRITDSTADAVSSTATVITKGGAQERLKLSIPGTYNLENALCAIGCSMAVGIPIKACVTALAGFSGIPGRMERIDEGQDFSVYVDFAVSPQAYEKTLKALRTMVGETGRVMVLCSSCGNRMREKRPQVGRICSEFADIVVATEDETYGEDPHAVLEEVWEGIDQSKCEAHKIFDRRTAIEFLLKNAGPSDAIVLCGMGPFSTFTKLEGRIPWDERSVAREILKSM
ncbi:UDP-N-acetylmuramyl-tripeptide synthetase [Candidatus Peregrinibacteria bacterium]|nr:UDP-N-acetylmuramyl-tripeptide synthetase [Candidatus Peregrinibacteria bacterium]